MAKGRTQTQQDRMEILAKIPPTATRVQVLTVKGVVKYKEISDLADTDEIQTKDNGDPIVMYSKPGRKSKASTAQAPVNAVVAEIVKRKKDAVAQDDIVRQIDTDPESSDLLVAVIRGLGEEQANLRFEIEEASREGKDSSTLSSKRIQALRATAETWLKRQDQMSNRAIDLESPAFQALFSFIMETMRSSMSACRLRDEVVDSVFAKFSSNIVGDEWKNEAKNRMKSS